jgi:hypothetical protein
MATSGTVTVKIDKAPGAIVTALAAFVNGLAGVEARTKNSLMAKLESRWEFGAGQRECGEEPVAGVYQRGAGAAG